MKIIRVFGPTATAVCLALASASVPLLAPAPAVAQAAQDDQIPTTNGNLTIHPVHHAGVVLTWNGKRIVADPTAWPPGDKSGAAEFRRAALVARRPGSRISDNPFAVPGQHHACMVHGMNGQIPV